VCGFKAEVIPKRLKNYSWERLQVTPEVATDITLTGIKLPHELVRELDRLLRHQIGIVKREVNRRKRKP
jgi:hypothetical protein